MSDLKQSALYESQVRLLIDILPIVMKDPRFALKGGTAINLFVRDLPRFSIDIDLTYLPIEPREQTFTQINRLLETAAASISKAFPAAHVTPSRPFSSGKEIKLTVEVGQVLVKVEANYILRGAVFPCTVRDLSEKSRDHFAASAPVKVMSEADLYGGKICATLDRQHPRDLFDVRLLLENEGLSTEIRQAFLVYLMSHNRPMSELLDPRWQDLTQVFSTEFSGMTFDTVTLENLIAVQTTLLAALHTSLTDSEREFLIEFKTGNADWSRFSHPHIQDFPGIKWKQRNLANMTSAKRLAATHKLERVLARSGTIGVG